MRGGGVGPRGGGGGGGGAFFLFSFGVWCLSQIAARCSRAAGRHCQHCPLRKAQATTRGGQLGQMRAWHEALPLPLASMVPLRPRCPPQAWASSLAARAEVLVALHLLAGLVAGRPLAVGKLGDVLAATHAAAPTSGGRHRRWRWLRLIWRLRGGICRSLGWRRSGANICFALPCLCCRASLATMPRLELDVHLTPLSATTA